MCESGTGKNYCFSLDGHLRPLDTKIFVHWEEPLVRIFEISGGPHQVPSFPLTRFPSGCSVPPRMAR